MSTTNTIFVPYAEVVEQTGISKRALNVRILREGIPTYVDGRDRRRRLLDARDIERLTQIRPAPRRRTAMEESR